MIPEEIHHIELCGSKLMNKSCFIPEYESANPYQEPLVNADGMNFNLIGITITEQGITHTFFVETIRFAFDCDGRLQFKSETSTHSINFFYSKPIGESFQNSELSGYFKKLYDNTIPHNQRNTNSTEPSKA